MIKVIQSANVWLPQTETWMHNQTKYLPEDVESHIVCGKIKNLDQFYLPNIHVIPAKSLLYRYACSRLKGAKQLARLLWLWMIYWKIKPDIVHSHFGDVGWLDSFVVRLTKTKHVVTFYGVDVNMFPKQDPRWIERYNSLFKSADLFLCEGPHMVQCLINMGCPKNKVKVQHLGVEVGKTPFKPRKWQPGEPLRVLIAASFREKKGIPYALEALGKLQKDVPLEITIIGDASPEVRSWKEKELILKVIEKHRMGHIVSMLGFQPYKMLFEEAYKHHIFLSPSVTSKDGDGEGGAPVTIIEMAASGMFVVSTKHCDIPGVIIDGKTGLLAEERDVDGLYERLIWLVLNPEKWRNMLESGRKHVELNFDSRKQGIKLAEIYLRTIFR